MRFIKTVALLLVAVSLFGQEVDVIPKPVKMKNGFRNFSIKPTTVIVVKNGVDNNAANFLNSYLKQLYGLKLKVTKAATANYIQVTTLQTLVPGKEGAYLLEIDNKGVSISGQTASGTFYGIQTLIQLLPTINQKLQAKNLQVPQLSINDYPRFGYRGMHLDCGRHFWPVEFVKKYIDYLALHKFNTFHWHLTEDQGWRIEIKKYPKLTSVGGWRNGTVIGRYPGTGNDGKRYGGYYTQEQIKEIVKYAADRFITVVPEIEMPGHSSAAIAAYPELSCFPDEPTIKYFPKQCKWAGDSSGKQVQQTWGVFDDVFCAGQEKTFQFLQDVMDEVLALFPSKIIHVGGDECPKENWHRCANCQKRIKDNNLKDEHELQSYFIQRMEKYLNSKGRTLMGWDEILEGGLAPNAMVMSWRGEQGGIDAAKQKHYVVMTPGNPVYFDHSQSENEDSVTIGGYNPIEKVYAYEPVPQELTSEESRYVLGAQANVWTEYMKNIKKVEYMIFPRMAALSEVLWSAKENKDWNDFERRLMMQFKRYDSWKANYSKAYFDLKTAVKPSEKEGNVQWIVLHKLGEYAQIRFDTKQKLVNKKDSIPVYDPIDISKVVKYVSRDSVERMLKRTSSNIDSIEIIKSGIYSATSYKFRMIGAEFIIDNRYPVMKIEQQFHFNKATGKKITLEKEASKNYPGDGAFTLVNGVQNEKGFARSKEFLGFSGDDCVATIDLGKPESISFVKVHYLHQPGSWIHQPASVTISVSENGTDFNTIALSNPTIANNEAICEFLQSSNARFIKFHIANAGIIQPGNPGAGNKAWLFVDEIEVK